MIVERCLSTYYTTFIERAISQKSLKIVYAGTHSVGRVGAPYATIEKMEVGKAQKSCRLPPSFEELSYSLHFWFIVLIVVHTLVSGLGGGVILSYSLVNNHVLGAL